MCCKRRSQQRGTAIFMAILMVAIVAGIAVSLARMQQIGIHLTQMMFTSDQAYLYSEGVIDWARGALIEDMQHPLPNKAWPLMMPSTQIAGGAGSMEGMLQDAEGLLNLNDFQNQTGSVSTPAANSPGTPGVNPASATSQPSAMPTTSGPGNSSNNQAIFSKLMTALELPLTTDQQLLLVQNIAAWNSPMPSAQQQFAYDNHYLNQQPPYLPPHAPMASVSELRMVKGVSATMYERLLPYIIALPTTTTLNIAHSPPMIQTLITGGNNGQNGPAIPVAANNSQYFLLRADVYLNSQHLVVFTLLQRMITPTSKAKQSVVKLWQSFGTE